MANNVCRWHLTRDGRVLDIDEMDTSHLVNARVSMSRWLMGETDPHMRRELKEWRRAFARQEKKLKKQQKKNG